MSTTEPHPSVDRFERRDLLGTGASGRVYRAWDHRYACEVALKELHQPATGARDQLKAEFRRVCELSHRNLVAMHDLVIAESGPSFFTMELITGRPLDPGSGLDDAAIRSAAAQVLDALQALHGAGLVHRDLKPSNVLRESTGRVVVLDFGLSELAERVDHDLAGTWAYLAPELLAGAAPSAASDVYSLGVLLLGLLTGAPPDPNDRGFVDPRRLADHDPVLAAVTLQCLQDRPDQRPPVQVLRRRLGPAPAAPSPTVGWAFVGRARELEWLRAHIATPGLVRIEGAAGVGKSTLVSHALSGDPAVLRGRCHPSEAIPFNGFDRAVDRLTGILADDPEVDSILGPIGSRFAVARGATPPADRVPIDEVARALAAGFARLGAAPVLWIDDAQWLDADSIRLLDALLAHASVAVVASHRPLAADDRLAMAPWFADAPVRSLAPLGAADANTLATHIAGEHSEALAAACEHDALLMGRFGHRWTRRAGSRTLLDIVGAELADAGEPAAAIVAAAAVHGGPVPVSVVAHAVDGGPRVPVVLGQLAQAGVLTFSSPSEVNVGHDRVRDVVLEAQAEPARRSVHIRLAEAFTERGHGSDGAIARHFDAGGQPESAHPFAVAAAETAESLQAWSRAARFYRLALDTTTVSQPHLVQRMGTCLASGGYARQAAEVLSTLGTVADRTRATELLYSCGAFADGDAQVQSLLAHLGLRAPRTSLQAWVRGAGWATRSRITRFEPRAEPDERQAEAADVLWTISAALAQFDATRSFAFAGQHLHLSLSCGDPARAARALALQASYADAAGAPLARVDSLERQADELATETAPPVRAWLEVSKGFRLVNRGDVHAAIEHFDAAEALYQGTNVLSWERTTGWVHRAMALTYLTDVDSVKAAYDDLRTRFVEIEDRAALAMLDLTAGYQSALAAGAVDEAEHRVNQALQQFPQPPAQSFALGAGIARVHIALARGRPEEAHTAAQHAHRSLRVLRMLTLPRVYLRYLVAMTAHQAGVATPRSLRRASRRLLRERVSRARVYGLDLAVRAHELRGDRAGMDRGLTELAQAAEDIGFEWFTATRELRSRPHGTPPDRSAPVLNLARAQGLLAPPRAEPGG